MHSSGQNMPITDQQHVELHQFIDFGMDWIDIITSFFGNIKVIDFHIRKIWYLFMSTPIVWCIF